MPSLTQQEIDSLDIDVLAAEIAYDIESDFIISPHFAIVFKERGAEFVGSVLEKLRSGYDGPRPPIQLLVPKRAGHYHPGAILEPFDRVVYHVISSLAYDAVGSFDDGQRAISVAERTLADYRNGTESRYEGWNDYNQSYVTTTESGEWVLVLDLAHYLERVPQHQLVNLLNAKGLSSNAIKLTERFLQNARMRYSHGILQGMLPSDYLGDLFLTNVDAFIERSDHRSIRFGDDVLISGDSREELQSVYREITRYLRGFGLQPNEAKTRIIPAGDARKSHTAIDQLFEEARREVIDELQGFAISDGSGLPSKVSDVDAAEVDLIATRRLLAAMEEHPDYKHRILRSVLSPLAAVADPAAKSTALAGFEAEVHLARDYARYLVRFATDEQVIEKMTRVVAQGEHNDPFLVMHAVAVLGEADQLPRPSLNSLLNLYFSRTDHTCRALAAIAIAKQGDGSARQDLIASFSVEPSEYVRSALVFAAQHFVQAEQRTVKQIWGRSSVLNNAIASRVL